MCSSVILLSSHAGAPRTHAVGRRRGVVSAVGGSVWSGRRIFLASQARERAPALWTHRARESDPVIAACGTYELLRHAFVAHVARPPLPTMAACPHLAHTTAASLISLSLAARLQSGTPSLSLGSARSLPAARSRPDSALGHTALRYPRASSLIEREHHSNEDAHSAHHLLAIGGYPGRFAC
jgi:hypothetical protein